jgi:hypothetical protein
LVVLAVGVAEILWQRRTPVLVLYPSFMIIRLSFLRRTHRLSYTEIVGWAHSARWVGFEATHSKRIYFPLQVIRESERTRLLGHLQSLKIGQPGFVALSPRDLERHERNLWIAYATLAIVIVAASFLYLLDALRNI